MKLTLGGAHPALQWICRLPMDGADLQDPSQVGPLVLLAASSHHHQAGMAAPTLAQPVPGANHAAVALASDGGMLDAIPIPTVRQGYDALIGWAELFADRPVLAMEGTSSFGAGLCRELPAAGFSVIEAHRPDRSTRRRWGRITPARLRELAGLSWQAPRWPSPKAVPNPWR